MSESVYEPGPGDDEVIDLDQAFGENAVDELIDTSYSPPERPTGLDAHGTTLQEQREGQTLDERLALEVPDPAMEIDLVEGEPSPRAGEQTPVPDVDQPPTGDPDLPGEFAAELPDELVTDGVLDDGEVGDARAGRLVDVDSGAVGDTEKDLLGTDVGVDAGAASAEEAAVHVIGESEADRRLRRDRSERPTI